MHPVICRDLTHGSGGSKTHYSQQVFGSGTASPLLAAAAQQWRQLRVARHDERAGPERSADLVCRQGDEICPDSGGIEGKLTGSLNGVAMKQGAMPSGN